MQGPGRRGTFAVRRKVPLKATQPRADLKPGRPTMVLKPKGLQKAKPGKWLRVSTGQASKENRENQAPIGKRKPVGRKSLARPIIPVEVNNKPLIVLSTPSPLGSSSEWSPVFTAFNSSLAEINGDGMPLTAEDRLLENVKRQTLSVCIGMSPLLLTKPFVFPKPAPCQMLTEQNFENEIVHVDESSNVVSDFEDPCCSPKRLSIEAKTTITKNKVPDSEMPSKPVNLRKNLFTSAVAEARDSSCGSSSSAQEFEDSLNEPNMGIFPCDDVQSIHGLVVETCLELEKPEEEQSLPVDCHSEQYLDVSLPSVNHTQSEVSHINVPSLPIDEPAHFIEEPSISNDEPSLTIDEASLPINEASLPINEASLPINEASLPIDEPFLTDDSVHVESSVMSWDNSAQLDADAFKIHTSVVTSCLTGRKRFLDPKDEAPPLVKKPRPQEVQKQERMKQQPRDRTMNRTLALRKAAASKKAGVSTTNSAKGQKRIIGQYKAKGPMKGVPMAKLNLMKPNGTGKFL